MADLLAFLQSAIAIRRDQALSQPVRPVTFYAWHDEMAGQLRFSTACCTRDTLPFGAQVTLVETPSEMVAAFLRSPYRDGISWNELEECTQEEAEPASVRDAFMLRVWAVDLCAIAT